MVYVFLAEGFEEVEAIVPVDILRRGGVNVTTVGIGGKVVTGVNGVPFTADITAGEIELNDTLEAVVLPGGMPGAANLARDTAVNNAIDYARDNGKYIAAICAAPAVVLAKRGLLDGKEATAYPAPQFEKALENADYTKKRVARDGKIITANGPGAAFLFGLEILSAVVSQAKADEVAADMQVQSA